jgi:hypothetical protein
VTVLQLAGVMTGPITRGSLLSPPHADSPPSVDAPPPPGETSSVSAAEEREFAGPQSTLEKRVCTLAQGLGPDESVELELGALVDDGVHAGASGRIRLEHEADGTYSATLEEAGELGVGFGPRVKAGIAAGAYGSSAVTAEAGLQLRFKTPESLADFIDAACGAQLKVSGAGGQALQRLAEGPHLLGSSPEARVAHYLALNTTEVSVASGTSTRGGGGIELEVFKQLGVGVSADVAHAQQQQLTYDVDRGVLRLSGTTSLEADAFVGVLMVGEGVQKGTLRVDTEVPLPRERLGELLHGDPRRFFEDLSKTSVQVSFVHEGSVASVVGLGGSASYSSSTVLLGKDRGQTEVTLETTAPGNAFGGSAVLAGVEGELVGKRSRRFDGRSVEECRQKALEASEHDRALAAARTQSRLAE